jgi:hypothetical protein
MWAVSSLGFQACTDSPTAPTETPTSAGKIESVVTTFRDVVVDSNPVVIPSPEVLAVEAKVVLDLPADSRVTAYLCVMETASSVGVGECIAVITTVAGVQAGGNVVGVGLRPFRQTAGMPRTTSYVYVGLTEGTSPWNFPVGSPPRVGDMFGSNRVLATVQIPRTVTFQ